MNKKPIKILISTHSPQTPTGLGATVRNIFKPLIQHYPGKYDISQLGYFHIPDQQFHMFDIPWPIYHTKINRKPDNSLEHDPADMYGQQSFTEVVSRVKPDIVFGYGDMWHFDHLLNSPLRNSFRLLSYYTIDGQPYYGNLEADGSTEWGKKLTKTDRLVVLSHFGVKSLKESCPELSSTPIDVRYHPLDFKMHKFLSPQDKMKFRKQVFGNNLPDDAFIIGWCGRNQFRKQNYKLWEALHYMVYGDYIECKDCGRVTLKEFNHSTRQTRAVGELTMYDANYDYSECWHCKSKNIVSGKPLNNVFMWFHMSKGENFYSPNFHERMWNVSNRCIWTNGLEGVRGLPDQSVFDTMALWDCMYYPTGGEGFSNPAFEVLACGVPVVYANYSSHAEFCSQGGLPVRVSYIPEPVIGIQRSIVDTGHAIEQLLKLYRDPELKLRLGVSGRSYVSQFTTDTMPMAWDSIFTSMMKQPLPAEGSKIYTTVL